MTWDHPDELDAVVAAPSSHRIVFENDEVRVLSVTVGPGVHEPEHTHRWPSVMVTYERARFNYFEGDELTFTSPDPLPDEQLPRANWIEPESPHSVQNIDTVWLRAIRFELKR